MSIEQFKAGISRTRNPVIVKTLGQLELIEEWGSGYKRIKNACEQGGYPLPKWEEFGGLFLCFPECGSIKLIYKHFSL